ncbi:MAG: DUF262 domain-containing protein [Nitrososphaerota archaeon]|nr:DUF262 domain-containing protein [Nitrososphaerota archaeon]
MEIRPETFKVENLAKNWINRTLRASPEYQRGLVWTTTQKQRLIDSVFRKYPLPSFFFVERALVGPDGNVAKTWEIVDGQQRIEALAGYYGGNWSTLEVDDPRLSLPEGLRRDPAPWSGKLFSQLGESEKSLFKDSTVSGFVIHKTINEEEIRDLFIRLQAGTALTRQQIRDAWPGTIGPFVQRIAGRGAQQPTFSVFEYIDRRGTHRNEELDELEDEFVNDRQTCAQLLTLYFEHRPDSMPSLGAKAIDDIYHQKVSFRPDGEDAERFRQILGWCDQIIVYHPQAKNGVTRKNQLFSLFVFLYELSQNRSVKVNEDLLSKIGTEFWKDSEDEPRGGKVIAPSTLSTHFHWFVNKKMANLVVPGLDPNRFFSESQKQELWEKVTDSKGVTKCASCGGVITRDEADFDHVTPWIMGGQTVISNCRVVHREGDCHLRGRAATRVVRT